MVVTPRERSSLIRSALTLGHGQDVGVIVEVSRCPSGSSDGVCLMKPGTTFNSSEGSRPGSSTCQVTAGFLRPPR